MLQRTTHLRRTLALAVILLGALSLPALAAGTEILRLPTAEVLPFGHFALEAGLPFESTVQRVEVGLPLGLQVSAAVPPGGTYDQGLTADLKYRALAENLLAPSVALGASYNTKSREVSPYAVITKGVLNADLTAGLHLDQLSSGAKEPFFAGVDLDVFGPIHALAEYDGGTTRFGAKVSLLNAEVRAYLEGNQVNLVGRLVLPF